MFKSTKRSRIAIPVAALLSLAVVGGAFAYWSQAGAGTGSVAAGTTIAVTVNQTNPAITGMYPGDAPHDLSGTFNNPNPGKVKVGTVSVVVANADGTAWTYTAPSSTKPACTAADFTITGTGVVDAEISAGNGVGTWSGITIQMKNLGTNQDNCKNQAPPLLYSVTPAN